MLLCLDVGNTHILGGIFVDKRLLCHFRYHTRTLGSSDQFGIFLQNMLLSHHIASADVTDIAIASVVPDVDYTVRAACIKYLNKEPFVVQPGVRTGIKIKYKNPHQVGADRIANALAAHRLFPCFHLLLADFSTATTVCVVTKHGEYLGGLIAPGFDLQMKSLTDNAAKLSRAPIQKPQAIVGTTMEESVQSGIYYAQLSFIDFLCRKIPDDYFQGEPYKKIATGSFAHLLGQLSFDRIEPDLVLYGLQHIYDLNHG